MKKSYTFLALLIPFFIAVLSCLPFCYDKGNRPATASKIGAEYHFNVDSTGYDIYTEDMIFIGRINYGSNPTLDSLIDKDNL